jgi:molybdenum cofactor biosynthesis protein B
MPGIDDKIAFVPVHIAIVTVSDTRSEEDDRSGKVLAERATSAGHQVVRRERTPDDRARIETTLRSLIDDPNVDVVISTGGTGVTGRDVTPEAFRSVFEKEIEGFGELFRAISFKHVGVATIQSRATAGVAKGKYLFALPGSPGACKDAWDEILVHQLDIRYRPCNFVELMPRLKER